MLYPMLHLGHNIALNDIRESLQPWLTSMDYGLYFNMLQVDDAVDIGWLLYSTQEMDPGALADKIGDIIGHSVGVCWKNINNGIKVREWRL